MQIVLADSSFTVIALFANILSQQTFCIGLPVILVSGEYCSHGLGDASVTKCRDTGLEVDPQLVKRGEYLASFFTITNILNLCSVVRQLISILTLTTAFQLK